MPRDLNIYNQAKRQVLLWTPCAMGSRRPYHQLDYQTDALTISGGTITGVAPRRGRNLNSWAAKSGGTNPALTSLRGFRTATFDGSQAMTHAVYSTNGFQNCTLMWAGIMLSGGNNEDTVMGFGQTEPNGAGRWMYRFPNATKMGFSHWSLDLGVSDNTSWFIGSVTPNVFAVRKIARNIVLDNNGTLAQSTYTFGSDAANVGAAYASIGGVVGSGGSQAYGTNMQVLEALWWEFDLTDREYQQVQAYLGWKYGIKISASNPWANRPPLKGD